MAKYTYDDYEKKMSSSGNYTNERKVGYFNSLKDDGEEAIVRFDYEDPSDFEIVSCHKVQIDGMWRYVSCLREDDNDPLNKCPFCEADNDDLKSRFFVKLVEYTADENGNIVANAKVWDRPSGFRKELKTQFEEYCKSTGTRLCDYVFKIKRIGKKGDIHTTYSVMLANPVVYKPELYPINFDDFANYDPAHHDYLEKTADEMREYLETGSFPKRGRSGDISNGTTSTSTYESKPVATATTVNEHIDKVATSNSVATPIPVTTTPAQNVPTYSRTTTSTLPSEAEVRPVRRYNFHNN